MKKIQALLGGVFFLGILCFLIPSKPIEIEETFSEQYNGESKQYYEVYLEESGVTTSNLEIPREFFKYLYSTYKFRSKNNFWKIDY